MKVFKTFVSILALLLFMGCNTQPSISVSLEKVEVRAADEWSQMFFRNKGWFGGDGIFFIPKSGQEFQKAQKREEQIILFSDTMFGQIQDDSLQPGFEMVNNSIAVLEGGDPDDTSIQFTVKEQSSGEHAAIFLPLLPDTRDGEYYWLGDGFVDPESGNTYIFAYRVINRPDLEIFQFEVFGGVIITIPAQSEYPYDNMIQKELLFNDQSQSEQTIGLFGAGIFVNTLSAGAPDPDGYIYIYGVKQPDKQLLIARVLPNLIEDATKWRFWDGEDWNDRVTTAATITDNVSNELSLTPLKNGQYLLVSQVGGIMESAVGIRVGDSPWGPFSETKVIWDCKESLLEPEFFPYNAKAHPTISDDTELLISYNVNSFKFWDQVHDHPHLYRPRFIALNLNSLYTDKHE